VAFVLDVNLRIKDILNLGKVESALSKVQTSVQTGTTSTSGGGTNKALSSSKSQTQAAVANAAAIQSVTKATKELDSAQTKASGSTRRAANSMESGSSKAKTFGESVLLAGKRYAAFLAATVVPFAALGGITKATASVIEFDAAMLKVRQITAQTEPQISGLRDTILDLSTGTGTSANELARIAKTLTQAGQRGKELTSSLTALSKVPLTPSFETLDAAIEGTIAATEQFRREGLETAEVLDVLTALSNKFAASSEDIAKGISRGGAAFESIGGTFKEFAAVFTTIRQTTRESAETVGTFMKTISSRLADPKIVNFLEGKGIRISEAIEAGDPVGAIKRIAAALQDITSVQDRIEIGTKLGGRRQISRLLALVNNVDVLNEALSVAASSSGEFDRVAQEGLGSLQAQLNILVQEFNKLVQTLAEPLFVPIIRGVTQAGKAFVSLVDFIKPVIPALTSIIGFAAGFKLLAVSIGAAAKALAFMSTVGVGGGIPGVLGALSGSGSGGAAGATAKERVQRRLAGGVGLAGDRTAVAATAGAGLAGGAKAAATSQIGQLAAVTGVILAADKLSETFEKTGNSSGILAAEFAKSVGVILVATSLLSGKSVVGAISGIVTALGPFGAAIAAAVAAIGSLTYAATQSVDIDVRNIIDAAAKKVAEIPVEPIALGDLDGLRDSVGGIGTEAILGVQEAADRYQDGLSGFFASAYSGIQNLLTGEGLTPISDSQAQDIIDEIVGTNPELLNEILKSAVEQFDVAGLEGGLDKLLAESFGGNIEVAERIRQAMIKQLGGFEKIVKGIDDAKIDAKTSLLANAIEKASKDFERLYIPTELSYELGLLSDAVGNAARAIELNVTTFDQLSQVVGRGVGVSRPGTEWSREAVEQLAGAGQLGDLIDLSQFDELEGFTKDLTGVGTALEDFMRSILASKVNADALRSALIDPQVDPFDILSDYIDKFISEYPQEIPPEAEAAFKAAASNLGQQMKTLLTDQAGVLPTTDEVQKAFDSVLGKQRPFYDAAISTFQKWLNAQSQQLNLALSAEELLANVDVNTSELKTTIAKSLQDALAAAGVSLQFPTGFDQGLVDVNDVFIDLAQNGDIVGEILTRYEQSYTRHAELNRQVAEAQKTGEGASLGLLQASKEAAVEVLNLQVALSQLQKIAQQAPQALAEQQTERRKSSFTFDEKAAEQETKAVELNSKAMSEAINRHRQTIEALTAIDVSQAFEEPANIFAKALIQASEAVNVFRSSLTVQDIASGRGGGDSSRFRLEPDAETSSTRKEVVDRGNLQSALFGGEIERVLETLLQSGAEIASSEATKQFFGGSPQKSDTNKEIARSLNEFSGFIYDIPKLIRESGLDPAEVARAAAEALKAQAEAPGAREVENIGALKRTIGDLTTSLQTLIERPGVAREPEQLIPQLTPSVQEYLRSLSPPTERLSEPETTPRNFENIVSSAADIQQAAYTQKAAADTTARVAENIGVASDNIHSGGADMLLASQNMIDSANRLQSIVDIPREVLGTSQEAAADGAGQNGGTDVVAANTEAISTLGERLDAVAQAVETQTQQAAELAVARQDQQLEVTGLEDNTSAISQNNEVASKTQESMTGLNDGLTKMASAIAEGVGIDVETMSEIRVDVNGIGDAARELTSEFEAVAQRVVKEEIRVVLQQLARASGNPELSNTFNSVT